MKTHSKMVLVSKLDEYNIINTRQTSLGQNSLHFQILFTHWQSFEKSFCKKISNHWLARLKWERYLNGTKKFSYSRLCPVLSNQGHELTQNIRPGRNYQVNTPTIKSMINWRKHKVQIYSWSVSTVKSLLGWITEDELFIPTKKW